LAYRLVGHRVVSAPYERRLKAGDGAEPIVAKTVE